jgi:integrase
VALSRKRDDGEDVASSTLTFGELAERFFASFEAKVRSGERSARSLSSYRDRYRTHLETRLGRVKAQSITKAQAMRLLDDLRESGASTATVSAAWKTFVRIVNFGNDRGLTALNISVPKDDRVKVRNARKVRVLNAEESNLVTEKTHESWRPLVEAARFTGARVSELLGLQYQDVDLSTGRITISKQLNRDGALVPPKTENGVRVIPTPENLRVTLLGHYNGCEDKSPGAFVFGQHTQPQGRYRLAARALAKAITDSGIEYDPKRERVSFHCFRHAVATTLIGKNVDPQTVADHLGDDVQTVLSTYVHSNGGTVNVAKHLEAAA